MRFVHKLNAFYALPTIVLLIATEARAASCPVFRNANVLRTSESFAEYQDSYRKCGVREDNLPFILKSAPDAPKLGTVVLVHGLTGNPAHVRDMANYLSRKGYNVVAPILYGHGGNESFLTTANEDQWIADVRYAGEVAKQMGDPLFLIGHSTGGALIALEAARVPGRYAAAVALDPALNLSGKDLTKIVDATCMAKAAYLAKYENDLLPSVARGVRTISNEEFAIQVREVVEKTVEQHCGKGFKLPKYNYHATLAGFCALDAVIDKVAKVSPKHLPPTLTLLSNDTEHYGPRVSIDDVIKYVDRIPKSKALQTDDALHGLMTSTCSKDYSRNMYEISQWLGQHGGKGEAQISTTLPGDGGGSR